MFCPIDGAKAVYMQSVGDVNVTHDLYLCPTCKTLWDYEFFPEEGLRVSIWPEQETEENGLESDLEGLEQNA